MKPSEKRALKEQKLKEKEEKTREFNNGDNKIVNEKKPHKKLFYDDAKGSRKEGFFQSHVRLITFIITLSILLALIGPFSVIRIVKWVNDNKYYRDGNDITLSEIAGIAAKKAYIEWDDFDGYNYDDNSTKNDTVKEYYVTELGYSLLVRGSKTNKKYPENVFLMYSDEDGTVHIDLRNGDVKKFISSVNIRKNNSNAPLITIEELKEILNRGVAVDFDDFEGFKCEQEQKVENSSTLYILKYKVAESNFTVLLEGKSLISKPSRAVIVNNVTLEEHDINSSDIKDFIS